MSQTLMYLRLTLYLVGKNEHKLYASVEQRTISMNTSKILPPQIPGSIHTCICCQTIHLSKPTGPVTQVSKVA